jgi:uncharacterized phage protein (TIGR02220 family)
MVFWKKQKNKLTVGAVSRFTKICYYYYSTSCGIYSRKCKNLSILRVEKNANYVVMNRTALNDKRLSWKAKGIMAYMLSMPDDWVFYINELTKHSTDGEKAFRSGLKELKENGYVKRKPVREGNKIVGWETIVTEIPSKSLDTSLLADFVQVQKEQVQNVHVQKEGLLSTDSLLNTDKLNTDSNYITYFQEIISYLNQKTNSSYKHTSKKTRDLIKARLKEGFTVNDFKTVIDKKSNEWISDIKMNRYLRPETLFGTKFESYLNQKGAKPFGCSKQGTGQSHTSEYDSLSI